MSKDKWPTVSSERTEAAKAMLDKLKKLRVEFYTLLAELTADMQAQKLTTVELVDIGFICRESEELLDNWRKDAKARKETAGKLLSLAVLQEAAARPETADTSRRGTLATASCDVALDPVLPGKGSPEAIAFVKWLLDNYAAETGGSTASLAAAIVSRRHLEEHWVNVGKLCTVLTQEGKSLPAGIGATSPRYFAVFTRRRIATSDSDSPTGANNGKA